MAISTAKLSKQSNSPESVTNDGNDTTTEESQNGVLKQLHERPD